MSSADSSWREEHLAAESAKHPWYQGRGGMLAWDVVDAYNLDFYLGNAVAIILRSMQPGNEARATDDLCKARDFLDAAIVRRGQGDPVSLQVTVREECGPPGVPTGGAL